LLKWVYENAISLEALRKEFQKKHQRISKKKLFLCRVPLGRALGKEFPKKNYFFTECLHGGHSTKNLQKEKLCRVALGKATVSQKIAVTFLCRGLLETLGKDFTKCPIKSTRQRTLYR